MTTVYYYSGRILSFFSEGNLTQNITTMLEYIKYGGFAKDNSIHVGTEHNPIYYFG